uniref:DNA repair protein RAD51 homolog 3 n=1 Tax=Plectus sambesii TaxID=2011161 RepID=A0A914WX76_9BILA
MEDGKIEYVDAESLGFRLAADLYQEELNANNRPISTQCPDLDNALRGGILLGAINEFVGQAGMGKSQICMQTAVSAHFPPGMGGVGGEVVYVDTEGCFSTDRIKSMIDAILRDHLKNNLRKSDGIPSVNSIMDTIYTYRCLDLVQMTSAIHGLESFVDARPKVRLVIVDSIACHFRQDFEGTNVRSWTLNDIVVVFRRLAARGIAVLVTNQVTTRFAQGTGSSYMASALGQSWSHHCTNRVWLYRDAEDRRCAHIFKSPYCS